MLQTLTTDATGTAGPSAPLTASASGIQYRVHESVAPPGYGLAPTRWSPCTPHRRRRPSPPSRGADEEPALPAQLGVAKIDAQTNAPLAGATFAFAFDSTDDGHYDQSLGSCTTGTTGTCQPPEENTAGGWLAGWYQITETAAPPGYWLDPTTATQTVFLQPGATELATVTFGDELLGSLQVLKTGDDTTYVPVAGAVFTVAGPAPSTASVGTLTVGTDDETGVLAGLVPGTYTVTETSAPPGYGSPPPFSVAVAAGHAASPRCRCPTRCTRAPSPVEKTDAATGDPLAGAVFDVKYDSADDGSYDVDLGDLHDRRVGDLLSSPERRHGPARPATTW